MDALVPNVVPLLQTLPNPATARRMSCLACPARSRTVCAALPDAEIDRVARIKRAPRRIAAGAAIFIEQEQCAECFTVLEGWVALTVATTDGGRIVLDFALPGDFIGPQANPGAPRAYSATAVTEVKVCPLPRSLMLPLVETDPALAKRLVHLAAMHEARGYDHLISNVDRDAQGRIAHLLVELYFRLNRRLPQAAGEEIPLPLTLALIGAAVGLTEVHVNRTLRRMREQGIVRVHHRHLRICDPERLIQASGVRERPLPDAATPVVRPVPRYG